MSESLIERIESAETKPELIAISQELGQPLNKRKGLETHRAELLDYLAQMEPGDGGADTGDGTGTPPEPKVKDADQGEGPPVQEPKVKDEPKPRGRSRRQGEKRKLRNRKNGRVFTYTAALAKKKDMEEV